MPRFGVLMLLQAIAGILAILFSKASAVYNWGNIGGRVDPRFEQWYAAMGPLVLLLLLTWLISIGASAFLTKGMGRLVRATWIISALGLPLALSWASGIYFHRGFPQLSG